MFPATLEWDIVLVNTAVVVVLWLSVAFLVSAVRALTAMNGTARDALKEGAAGADRRVLALLDQRSTVVFTLQALAALVAIGLILTLASLLTYAGYLLGSPLGLGIAIQIPVLAVVLAFGAYLLPKWISSRHGLAFARSASTVVAVLHYVFAPLSRPIAGWLERTIGYGNLETPYISEDDFKTMADLGEKQGAIEEEERELIHSILEFGDTTVREIMVSRMDMNAMPLTATLDDAFALLKESGHSRLPLYDEHIDHVVGIIYVKDLLPFLVPGDPQPTPDWRAVARKTLFVPFAKPLVEMLKEFQTQNIHMAIVVDEYGGTAGLVTMEDVLEEIVGDIRDETDDEEEALHQQVDEFTHNVDARIHIDDLMELLQVELDVEKYDFETLGGLIFHLTGDIPAVGDEIVYDGLSMRIESVENHRIGRVLVHVHPPTEDKSFAV